MDWLHTVGLAAGLAWASGIRLYAVLLIAGALARLGYLDLPPTLAVLEHPYVMAAAGVMAAGEFVADKVPAFDSLWDVAHTFVRIPAGAFLAAAALGQADPVWVAVAAIVGGAIASGAHFTKAGGRAVINTSPEPFSNWTASIAEDLLAPAGFIAAVMFPAAFLVLLVLFLIGAAWIVPRIWSTLRSLFRRLHGALVRPG
jgi:Domain of unknown function (DUF4126)